MRRTLRSCLFATLALGALTLVHAPSAVQAGPAPVIGGHDVAAGDWLEVAGVADSRAEVFCTGTLVAPTVVLTAAHCIDSSVDKVILGTNSWENTAGGEVIQVAKKTAYPNGLNSFDIGVIVLATPARTEPRAIATGWASLAIKTGAMATVAGYGAIDRDSRDFVPTMQEAVVPITDADCTTSSGCNATARPAGELGAGGMGVDTCQGDSGGPLFVTGAGGTWLAGVTSRGYDDNQFTCSEGGIYARPDKIIAWIESTAGVEVRKGPTPSVDPLVGLRGGAAETRIEASDPDSSEHVFEITTPPQYATAKVRGDGTVRVCLQPDVTGSDQITVKVTDKNDAARSLSLVIPITIEDMVADGTCNLDDFSEEEGGGCCDSGRHPGGALPLGVLVLGALVRRRRRGATTTTTL